MNIWKLRVLRVSTSETGETWVSLLSVRDLLDENRGYKPFVRGVLGDVTQGKVYDDSDSKAYVSGGPFVWYMPASQLHIGSEVLDHYDNNIDD